jgi:branched-chain amino acid transport system substrate-binding protein
MNKDTSTVTRRGFIRVSAGAAALLLGGALLEACGGSAGVTTSSAPASSVPPAASKPATSSAGSASAKPAAASASAKPAASGSGSAKPAASSAASAQSSGAATASGGPIKIGFITSLTGAQAIPGEALYNGFEMYMSSIGMKIAGRPVQIIKEDEASDPKPGLDKAKKLVEQDKVDLLAGVILTPTAYAIRDYLEQSPRKVMFVVANAGGNDLDTSKKSDLVVRTSFSNAQANIPMGPYVFKTLGLKSAFVTGPDYAAGHEKLDPFKKTFTEAGGKVAGEAYPPLGNNDYAPYISKIQQANPETTYAFFAGADALKFVQTYAQFGLNKKIKLTGAGDTVDDTVLQAEGQAAVGAVTTLHWVSALDNAENKKFLTDYKAKYNKDGNAFAVQAWDAGYLIDHALQKVDGNADPAKSLPAMLGMQWNSPRGPLSMSPQFHDVVQNIYVLETVDQGGKPANTLKFTFEKQQPA